jgi:putative transposase
MIRRAVHRVQDNEHFFVVCRYVERNALRAGLAKRAEQWRWGSLWHWLYKPALQPPLLSPWPLPRLPGWVERVNTPLTEPELAAVRLSDQRGRPLSDLDSVESIASRLNLESTMRPRGRQKIHFPSTKEA